MILSPQQLNELLAIVDNYSILFVAHNVGPAVLSEQDKALLQINGIDISKIPTGSSKVAEAYRFGMLSQILHTSNLQGLTYPQLKKNIAKLAPLTTLEQNSLQSLQFQTYQDIKKLGQSIKSQVTDTFVVADKKRHTIQHTKLVTDAAKSAIEDRKYLSEVVSILGAKTGDWDRDLRRIADFVLHTAFDEGRITQIQKEEGDNALVYKDVYAGACQHCQRLFLQGGISSEPIIFTVAQLKANGTNIGYKVAEWRAVIGPIHPWCFSDDTEVLTDQGWKLFKDVTLQEKFLSLNLETQSSEWVEAIHKIEYFYRGIMHSIESRDFCSLTTPNHRHVINVDSWSEKKPQLRLVEGTKLPLSSRFLRTIPNWQGSDNRDTQIDGINFTSVDWFEFMGWYISEGSIAKHSETRWEINITQVKEQYREEIISICNKLFTKIWIGKQDIVVPIDISKGKYSIEFIKHFEELGKKSHLKRLPKYITESSIELIKIFLLAFAKGDGTFDKPTVFENYNFKGQTHYYTASEILSAQIGELILKTGEKPSYTRMKGQLYEGYQCVDVWKISAGTQKYTLRKNSTTKEDRLKEVQYEGMVYDVELESNHTLFVRRNGRVWVSGNCRCTIERVPKGFTIEDRNAGIWEWNGTMFIKNWERFKELNKPKVERKSKVGVTVNNKKTEI